MNRRRTRFLSLDRVSRNVALAVLSLSFLTACGGVPQPLAYPDLEGTDRRFTDSRPAGATSIANSILEKEELSLADVLAIAEAMNPELAAERKNLDIADSRLWEARLYPNPAVLLQFEEYRAKDRFTIGRMERTAGLSVPLVYSGRIGRATSLAEKEREIAAVQYLWRRREILTEVKRAFVRCLAARRTLALARETRDLAQALYEATEERFRVQAVPEMELLKAAVARAKAEIDVQTAEKDEAVALQGLHALMGNVDLPKKKLSGDLVARFTMPSLEALRGQVTGFHPLLESARIQKEAAEHEVSLARAERFPDLAVEVTAGKDPADDTILEGGLAIPLPVFNRNQARIAGAEAKVGQAQLRLQAVRNELLFRLEEAYRTFVAAQDRVAVYQADILPKAEKAVDQTHEGYRLGKFGQLDVLDAQRTLAEARIAYAAALADLNLAASELEKFIGMRLEPLR